MGGSLEAAEEGVAAAVAAAAVSSGETGATAGWGGVPLVVVTTAIAVPAGGSPCCRDSTLGSSCRGDRMEAGAFVGGLPAEWGLNAP